MPHAQYTTKYHIQITSPKLNHLSKINGKTDGTVRFIINYIPWCQPFNYMTPIVNSEKMKLSSIGWGWDTHVWPMLTLWRDRLYPDAIFVTNVALTIVFYSEMSLVVTKTVFLSIYIYECTLPKFHSLLNTMFCYTIKYV